MFSLRKTVLCLVFLGITQLSLANFKDELSDYAFSKTRTLSLIVQYKGKVIYNARANSWPEDKPHLLWSMSKSVMGQLLGIAVYEGRITLEESICEKLSEYKGSTYCAIKVVDLLNFASGLRWNEVYENSIVESSPISLLYGKNKKGLLSFVLNEPHDLRYTPGTVAMYSSGDTLLLSKVIQRAYSAEEYAQLPWKKWANKIGINSLVFERDSANTFMGSSYAYLTAADTLKWGNFLLNNGAVNGKQILPKWWLKYTTQVSSAYVNDRIISDGDEMMGKHWWVNTPIPSIGANKAWHYAPADMYIAAGHWGQVLAISPSEDLVIVRYGEDKESGTFKFNELVRYVLQLAHDKRIPENPEPSGNPHLVKENNSGLSYKRFTTTTTEIGLFAGYKAKEYCSCIYVMKQSESYCSEFVKNKAVPSFLVPLRHDKKEKVVNVNGRKARFVSEQYGCTPVI